MVKIDILLPYWGDFKLLKKAVDSVMAQTSNDWKLSIFDDHDPSLEAKKYFTQLKDSRISYYRHNKNIGITNNFNFAIKSATAEYCILLGSDDLLLPNYVEVALQNIGNNDFYQPGVQVIDDDDAPYRPLPDRIKKLLRPKKAGVYSGEKLAASLCTGNWLYFPSITWKTDNIKQFGFDNTYKIVEDVVLELNIIKDGGKLLLDNEILFQYRRSANSLSSREKVKGGVRFNEEAEVYSHFAKVFKEMGWKKAYLAAKVRLTSRAHELIG